MKNGWTGGQYSLARSMFGAYLMIHFLHLVPWARELFSSEGVLADGSLSPLLHLFPNVLALWDGSIFVTGLVILGAALCVPFAAGWHDRPAAIAIWYIWACLHGRMPLIGNPGLPYVGWLLLAHACLPPAPYGSWAARGRADPGGAWRMPGGVFLAAWVLMALGYTYSGWTKLISPSWLDGTAVARVLENPLARPGPVRDLVLSLPETLLRAVSWGALSMELTFAPLALVRRLRPWLWGMMLSMHLGLMFLIDFVDLSLGMVMLHLFTFDPGWIGPRRAGVGNAARADTSGTEWIFYDGHCGLCNRAVRFVLAEDPAGRLFRFAPLGGETFLSVVPLADRVALPDSLMVRTVEGALLTRTEAVRHVLRRLGGAWRLADFIAGILPRRACDRVYSKVAAVRGRLFAPASAACSIVPQHLRERFAA
jgi:predicted DCC family thiol-disulfide oxidoreductase YuxK